MSHPVTELVIEAGHTERNYWRDLFRYRELFYFLAWRDVLSCATNKPSSAFFGRVLLPAAHDGRSHSSLFSRDREIAGPEGMPYPVMVFVPTSRLGNCSPPRSPKAAAA